MGCHSMEEKEGRTGSKQVVVICEKILRTGSEYVVTI